MTTIDTFCRPSADSDLHLRLVEEGHIECAECRLAGATQGRTRLYSTAETIAHIHAHRRAGSAIPLGLVARLAATEMYVDTAITSRLGRPVTAHG